MDDTRHRDVDRGPADPLPAVLGAGAFVEAVAGFGGTVLALSLGARWFGIEALLGWLLPLNLGLSAALALRGRRAIAWRTLGTAILPMILAFSWPARVVGFVGHVPRAEPIEAQLKLARGAARYDGLKEQVQGIRPRKAGWR